MDYAYDPKAWHDFYICVGGAAAALAGLLFVALSFQQDKLAHGTPRERRAVTGFLTLVTLLVASILLLTPGQANWLLGSELAILGAGALGYALYQEWITLPRLGFFMHGVRLLVNAGAVLLLVGGVSLATGHAGGLYWLVPAILGLLVGALLMAWRLILGVSAAPGA
jgi:hypothetical protein